MQQYDETSKRMISKAVTFFTLVCYLVCASQLAAQTVIFSDDLDDNSAGWIFRARSNDTQSAFGSAVDYGWDYSAAGIPEAPNSAPTDAATRGFRLRTNALGLGEDQAGVILEDASIAGKYTVSVDMWLNWAADSELIGTTEHGGLFVGKDTTTDPADPNFPVERGAGILASTDGDCSNCDYILLKNRLEMDTYSGQYAVRDFGFGNQHGIDNTDANDDPLEGALLDLPAELPSFNISEANGGAIGAAQGTPSDLEQPAGALGFQWVTLTAEVDPTATGLGPGPAVGTAKFSITVAATGKTLEIGTVDNSRPDILDDDMDGDSCQPTSEDAASEDICVNQNDPLLGDFPVDLEGQISLVLVDFFTSVAGDVNLAFALFDNVNITAIEDSGLPGDFNDDGMVNLADYTVWRNNLGATDDTVLSGNGDATPGVDAGDYAIWKSNFGSSSAASASAATVPEPPAYALAVVLGIAATLFTKRRVA